MQKDRKEQLLNQLATAPADESPHSQANIRVLLIALLAFAIAMAIYLVFAPPEVVIHTAPAAEEPAPVVELEKPRAFTREKPADLTATGYIAARRQATVSAKIIGKIASLHIEEGEYIKKGQLIATLEIHLQQAKLSLAEAQLDSAKAALGELKVMLQQAEAQLARLSHLRVTGLASEAELEEATTLRDAAIARLAAANANVEVASQALMLSQAEFAETQIKAPFSGVVTNKTAQPGEIVSPMSSGGGFTRTGICSLVDMESLEIVVDVTETNINRVTPKQPVIATLNAYPDWQLKGEVITLIPTADRNRATVRVRIKILQTDPRILPDMGVRVTFNAQQRESAQQSHVTMETSS